MAGYGWIFPLGDGVVNVGAGLLNTFKRFQEVSARKVIDAFVATAARVGDHRGERRRPGPLGAASPWA